MCDTEKTVRTAQVWVLKRRFKGTLCSEDFELQEQPIRDILDGELVCQAEYISVDPYVRFHMGRIHKKKFPSAMVGAQVARVIESKNTTYPVGSHIYGHFGWRSHTLVTDLDDPDAHLVQPYPCPDTGALPRSYALGCLGRIGNCAHFGVNESCAVEAGQTFVVSGAATPLGCLVGQLAKLKDCRVIGIAAGSRECEWLRNELGFDVVIDADAVGDALAEELDDVAWSGVDAYFDIVGGTISSEVIRLMNKGGRISVCASVSDYEERPDTKPPMPDIVDYNKRQLRLEFFLMWHRLDCCAERIARTRRLLEDGQLKYAETVTEGFEHLPTAFLRSISAPSYEVAVVKV